MKASIEKTLPKQQRAPTKECNEAHKEHQQNSMTKKLVKEQNQSNKKHH
jgi:hypothetical protein